jgi:hypothetical protein
MGGGAGGVVERMSVTELFIAGFLLLLLHPTTIMAAAKIARDKACFIGDSPSWIVFGPEPSMAGVSDETYRTGWLEHLSEVGRIL